MSSLVMTEHPKNYQILGKIGHVFNDIFEDIMTLIYYVNTS
jgi:hypothetical protein